MDNNQVIIKKIPEWRNVTPAIFQQEIIPLYRPAILKGIFEEWPIVKAGRDSVGSIVNYLNRFNKHAVVEGFVSSPEVQGNFSYKSDFSGFNFEKVNEPFELLLKKMLDYLQDQGRPRVYIGSARIIDCLPDLMNENPCSLVGSNLVPRIWLGNPTIIQPHFDYPDNLACVVSGRRRFTLFPPQQISNLYVGPIDVTPAGQAISLVSLKNPDFEKFPKFKQALAEAMVAELEPGDAIYIPSLWWHNVEAVDSFNVLINYWSNSGIGLDSPQDAMIHALMTMQELSSNERMAWRHIFDHYVFQTKGDPVSHLPEHAKGVLGPMNSKIYHAMRTYLKNLMGIK